jgi:hypothetical protein
MLVILVFQIKRFKQHCADESLSVRTGTESTTSSENTTLSASTTSAGTGKSPPLKRFRFLRSKLSSQSTSSDYALPASGTDNVEKIKLQLTTLITEFRGRSHQSAGVDYDNAMGNAKNTVNWLIWLRV